MLVTSIRCPDHNRICDLVVGVFTDDPLRYAGRETDARILRAHQTACLIEAAMTGGVERPASKKNNKKDFTL